MTHDSPFAALGNTGDTEEVAASVGKIVHAFAPAHDLTPLRDAFSLLSRAFDGQLPGYQKLKTLYHNRTHANEVVLCAARMLHGLHLAGQGLDAVHIDAALIGALMHDVGYLMKDEEASGTGAQFTAVHVPRGVEFARTHLTNLAPEVLHATTKVIQLTDHTLPAGSVRFDNAQQRLAACATSTADLVGQMANREYLERLLLLYFEFEEAHIGDFADVHDLLERTMLFYRVTKSQLDDDLNGLFQLLNRHFREARGDDRNFYTESIERNLAYLDQLVKMQRDRRLARLKRGGVVEQIIELKGGI